MPIKSGSPREDIYEEYRQKDKPLAEEEQKLEFLITTYYRMKGITPNTEHAYRNLPDYYTDPKIIEELDIFTEKEQENLVKWSERYNDVTLKRLDLVKLFQEVHK